MGPATALLALAVLFVLMSVILVAMKWPLVLALVLLAPVLARLWARHRKS